MRVAEDSNVIIVADLRHEHSAAEGADASLCETRATGLHIRPLATLPDAATSADGLYAGPGEITNRTLIEAAAHSGLPLLLDTTGATLKEVTRAVGWHQLAFRSGIVARNSGKLRLPGNAPICVLHGVVGDAPPNLRALTRMHGQTFVPVGLVDQSVAGLGALAVALGACVLVRRPPGLAEYAATVRAAQAALGLERKLPDSAELAATVAVRKRVVAAVEIAAGTVIGASDVEFASPGPAEGEFAPFQAGSVIGRRAAHTLAKGQAIRSADLDGEMPDSAPWFAPRPPREKPPG